MEAIPRSFLSLTVRLTAAGALLLSAAAGFLLTTRLLPNSVTLKEEPDPQERTVLAALQGRLPLAALLPAAVVVLLGLGWLYWQLVTPLQLLRRPEEVGYIPVPGRTQAQVANEVRRRRKKGDLPPVYPNGWYRVLDSHQLQKGAVTNATILGEQVAVYRGQDGQAYVVDAYCPHLGANLAVGGRVVDNCIECPFHGWQFRGEDGKCTKIPYADKVPEFAKIKTWASCEINGMIFVWYHCDGHDPTWSIPEQEEITSKDWVFRGRTEHFVNAHIQEIPENAADVAHLSHLHTPAILSGVDLRYTNSRLWNFVKHSWKVEWNPESEPNKHCSQMLVKHALTIFGKHFSLLDVNVVARQVGPGLVFLSFEHSFLGRGVILHCVTPVEPLLQKVAHSIYYQANIPVIVPKFILGAECIQFERDVMIWNNKKYISKPLLVKEDSAIQRHRRWFSQFYSENSPRLTFQEDGLNW
ncbi:cholesterol 7-desaturase nvd [Latimeria chalumnae]|uniref:cholesterol 7-desaturase n=1 Tax=Latimeria chalumnae TaxID=7897 RepID=H3AHT2_LATCH|nr:PREDICTED: cholesterol 7-desaturase-like [Latimeria chalumnae]|eukprot:XP_006009329.1 PREDICTED: cholesterol 7-desaturase-like [Latimeria chalumnae]